MMFVAGCAAGTGPLLSSVTHRMDERIAQVFREMVARGITVIHGGHEAERHLASIPAVAAYLPVEGEPGIVIAGANATYADIRHEEHHSRQCEARGWRVWHSDERAAVEVDTHRYVLDHDRDWGLSPHENAENEKLLEYRESQLS